MPEVNRTQFLIDLNRYRDGKMKVEELRKNWREGKYPKDDWAIWYLREAGL